MTTRARQILQKLEDRLGTVRIGSPAAPLAAIYNGREDLYGDDIAFPCASIIETPETVLERTSDRYRVQLDIDIVGITVSDPDRPLDAGHALLQALMVALYPVDADQGAGYDRLDGLATGFEYLGREILPREDGGQTTAVLINTRVEYVLHAYDPSK